MRHSLQHTPMAEASTHDLVYNLCGEPVLPMDWYLIWLAASLLALAPLVFLGAMFVQEYFAMRAEYRRRKEYWDEH